MAGSGSPAISKADRAARGRPCYHRAMRPELRVLVLAASLVSTSACSDEKTADPADVFGGTGATGSSSPTGAFCHDYCQVLVDEAPGCETYNQGDRCELICDFYMKGACETTYEAFASCLRETKKASCEPAADGKVALVVASCHEQYTAWIQCREERDAGICPY